MSRKTIAVDWDGTLVTYDGYKGPLIYGAPISKMVVRIQHWIDDGHEVMIFTSRVSSEHSPETIKQESDTIQFALRDMGLPPLEITANKYARINEFWDDRGVRVERNTGIRCEDLGTVQRSK